MADRIKKEVTPPPLLLMPAGGGLTLNPPDRPNILMPVVQSEPSLIDEDCEADSFVGQGPSADVPLNPGMQTSSSSIGSFNYFQQISGSSTAADPFGQIGQSSMHSQALPHPVSHTVGSFHGSVGPPTSVSTLPSSQMQPGMPQTQPSADVMTPSWSPTASQDNGGTNIFRQKGPMRYAQPPTGTYATGPVSAISSSASAPFSVNTSPPAGFAPSPFVSLPPSSSAPTLNITSGPPLTVSHPTTYSHPSYNFQPSAGLYQPVRHHWCYMKMVEEREIWYTFSRLDSNKLEEEYKKVQQVNDFQIISTDGGRYDVDLSTRLRRSVYWEEDPSIIRRCSWFYKRERDNRYVPYEEDQAQRLEAEYKNAITRNDWHKRLEFPGKETIVMHNPNVIVHFQASSQPDEWGNVQVAR